MNQHLPRTGWLCALLALLFCGEIRAEDVPAPRAVRRGGEAQSGLAAAGWLPGVAVASQRVTMAAPLEGTLASVRVQEGQHVAAGDLLAQMDNRVAAASVRVAEAAAARQSQLAHARQEVAFYEQLVQRLNNLRSADLGSEFELLEANTQLEQARAALERAREDQQQAREQLALAQARLELHNIRAPFAGQVVRLHAVPGATLTHDDPLLALAQLDELEVELHLPVAVYPHLTTGRTYRLLAGSPVNRHLEVQLRFKAPIVDAPTNTFRAVFTIDNPSRRLPAGFSVRFDPANLTRDGGSVAHGR